MASTSLLAAAALAGLVGSPHCVAMCGAGCLSIGADKPTRAWAFQGGRVIGYAALGAAVAATAGALQWAAEHSALLKPFWAMFHVAVIALGASLLWVGAQPAWIERGSHRVWQALRLRTLNLDTARWPLLAGTLWALLPCGLLYSALMLAALGDTALDGAAVMAAFAVASGLGLHIGASQLRRLRERAGRWGVRVAGLALMAASTWGLGHGLWDTVAALCA